MSRYQSGYIYEASGAFFVRYYVTEIVDGTPRRVQSSYRLCEKDDKHHSRTCKAVKQLAADHIPLQDLRFVLIGDAAANPPSGPTGLLDTWGATPFGHEVDALLGWSNLDDVTTPNDLYPTDVFTVVNDFFADTATPADFAANPLGALWQDFVGFFEHGAYLGGLPESEIVTAIDTAGVVDGATTYFTLADPVNLLVSLWDTWLGSFGIVVP